MDLGRLVILVLLLLGLLCSSSDGLPRYDKRRLHSVVANQDDPANPTHFPASKSTTQTRHREASLASKFVLAGAPSTEVCIGIHDCASARARRPVG